MQLLTQGTVLCVVPCLFRPAESSGRFAVYDLLEAGPPRNFIEAAERGDENYIIKTIERTIDFNINQTVCVSTCAHSWL